MLVLKTNVIYYLLFNEAKYFLSKKLKKNYLFLFTHYTLCHCISLTIFSYSLLFSLSFTCSHSRSSLRLQCPQSHSLGLLLLSSTPSGRMVFLLFLHLFLLFFLPHASHQITINGSTQALTYVHDIRQKA